MTAPLIQLRGITKRYGSGATELLALKGITLDIAAGEFVAIMGPSGSGKSTAMNILGCLDTPSAGQYLFKGAHVEALSRDQRARLRRRYLGFVFQGFNLLARTSALENVELPLLYRGDNASARREAALKALQSVGLGGWEQHTPAELSGGQQQRVAIARAIVTEPAVVLADEPTGNLDTRRSHEIMVLLLALRSVRRNLLRSFLTILGIVIGVSAVITMVTVGNGATQAIKNQISGLGTNLLLVMPGQRVPGGGGGGGGVPQFIEADAEAIAAQIGGVAAVAPQGRAAVTVVANGRNWSTSVTGSTAAWFETGNWKLAAGRIFEPDEQQAGAAVCLIGETVRRELFGGTAGQTGLGEPLRIKQFSCEIIGLLAAKGQSGMGDQDDTVLVPLHTLQRRVTGNRKVNTLSVSMEDGADSAPLKASLRQLLRERRKLAEDDDDNFNIFDTQQLAETLSSTMGVLTTLLGAVAAVSLLVGGIGIMNIMLVSVTERTREIGLRLAVGALEREVLLQFLIEAVVLSALGGLVGIVIATAASWALAGVMDVPYAFDPGINALSLLFSAAIGVLFGYVPARRAARMDPIEALRHE